MYREAEKLLFDFDYAGLRRHVADMEERCRRLTAPKPTPSLQDQLREGGMNRLLAAHWSTPEADALRYFARHGDRLGVVTPSSAQLGDRTVARAEVREETGRRGWSKAHLSGYARNEEIAIEDEAKLKQLAEHGPIVVRN
jgi:hypothetical protein